ncbi:MAG: SUMF1/EgtB/PvdO family nonheme iron enzyme [Bacteroidales bacterium]|nr:SUMF1/EgtB/PvdO family nonheme iron enzyme [Bacteroidales bacterium]MBR1799855.1 SUMF1/EgtB/PvdO family nonheme iron enzyme [Bacteroidales bacterium]MBR1850711.1 SUMF1/EgtB/PvdO family nonheme iron enzyme [Bacteroidales bacterium]
MKLFRMTCLVLTAGLLLTSCFGKSKKSSTTGWNLNDPKWGGYEVSDATEQATAPGLVFIEGGSFVMGHVSEDPRYSWDNVAHTVTVSSFYMDETEVSNEAYGEFVYWMRRAYNDEYPEKVRAIYPDTAAWRDKLAWRESFVDYYFQSPNYKDYPVVGVSWEQAQAFCTWRTDRVNEKVLIDRGVINNEQENLGTGAFQTDVYLAGLFEGEVRNNLPDLNPSAGGEPRNVRKADGILYPYYRLPTEAEWEFAALGHIGNTYDERVTEHKTYPWAGQSLRSANKKYYGQFLANFKRTRGDAMGVAGNLNDGWDYTCPVKWYFPNDYGLYNMAGNVSEWCMDVYRKTVSPVGADDLDPFRGNIYRTAVRDEDDAVQLGDDGMVVYKDVDFDANRRNYRQANNVNYLDGDRASNLENWRDENIEGEDEEDGTGSDGEDEDEDNGTQMSDDDMYTNNMYRRTSTDKDSPTSSLVNNKVRVVKGGSWKDRAYYLQSGTRRYYDQDKSTSWIGFRCAMDRLGSRTK